jgi:hypothetical protein
VGSCPDRFCSVFIYLNDVAEGGRTTFSKLQDGKDGSPVPLAIRFVEWLKGEPRRGYKPAQSEEHSLRIVPLAGMAVIHFPTTVSEYGRLPDYSTMHESELAISPKYIVQQYTVPPICAPVGAVRLMTC